MRITGCSASAATMTNDSPRLHQTSRYVGSGVRDLEYQKWHSQCKYKCGVCKKEFREFRSLERHITSADEHGLTMPSYLRQYKTGTEKVRLPCPVCGKLVLMTYFSLHDHASRAHQMPLRELYQRHKISSGSAGVIEVQDEHATDSLAAASANPSTDSSVTLTLDALEDTDFVAWYSGCEVRTATGLII